ncbi:peptidase family A16 [Ostertagia ostertagi]
MFDSQKIRRQIGIQKKKLARHIEVFKQILRDNNIPEKEVGFQQFSDEEITEFQEEIIDARNKLLKAYSLIERLHTEWSSAQEADPNERLVFTQYLEKYGDYTKTIQEAVSTLENSDELLNHLDTEFAKRQLPIQMTQPHNYEGTPQQLLHVQQLSSKQQRQETTSTTNFVDASILSRLDLPSFDGNLLEYPEFFARYSTLIGDKKELDDTTKFSLLKSCLRGRALHSIQGLALTATNYQIALDILKTRFDDKVTTRHILFSQLANLPPCDPEGKNLQSLYNKMFALTRQFCSYEDDSKEIALGAILINKLPRHIRSRIYDATGNSHNLTPTELLHILTSIVHKEATLQEIEFHCKSFQHPHEDAYASLHRSQKKNFRESPRFRREPTHTRRLQPTNSTSNKLRCTFCESNQHSTFYCTKFPTPQLRAQITRDKKLCFNCLSSKHRTKECPSKKFCQTCARRHHTTLCFQTSAKQQDQRKYRHDSLEAAPSNVKHKEVRNQQVHFVSSAVPSTTQQENNTIANEVTASTNSSDVLLTPPSTPVLLMCTEVEVFNPKNPEQVVKTTAFLDSGSSRSYITTDLANRLALPIEETEELSMFTFGTVKPVSLSATHHAIGLQTLKGAQILFVKAIQHLTNDLKIVTFTEELEKMATFAAESKKPSILIGADYFWNIILSDDFYVKNLPSDASKAGYCAVAYLVEINETRSSTILMSKTRLAPLKSLLTIPRLELSAINLGSMLLKHILANLDIPIDKTFIWSDSNVALMWIKSRATLPVFIRNRINSIRMNAPDAILRFTPGNSNPADAGSRGVSIGQLVSDDTWWKGPHFLTKTEDHWPADISSEQNQVSCHVDEVHTAPPPTNTLFQPERFSSWLRLLRVVYTILLFIVKKSNKAKQQFGESSSQLHEKAEAITEQLNLYFCKETKLWKSRGRVENADLPKEAISPVYLPRESHITSLYVLHVHVTNNHCGVNHILTELRQKVWITKGRHTIKRVLNKLCYHCKRYTAQPFKLPEFPPHPAKRVRRPNYPFESVGMDYAGPLLCKSDENIPAKYWIILLTCLNTRAIYVDLVSDMSAKKLLHTLRRFFATVAYPKWILCDNSQTFKSIADLQSSFTTKEERGLDIIDYCAQRKIEFKFIPSFSPWQDKNLERGQWQIGQIISSSDNYQRSANVKLPSKRIITRPINLLCKMEICDTKETTPEEASPPTPPRGHPMMTRSKTLAKNAGTLLSLAIVVTLCSTTNASTRCPSELNIPKKIIYATNCVNQGVALATYQSSEGTKVCWFPISCPTGHIRVSIPLLQNQALCGPECTCPSWATSCSFTTTSKRNSSNLSNVPFDISSYVPDKAWGVTTKEYYGHLAPMTSEMKISAICVKGGAQITSTVPMDALEACIANYCLFITNSTNSPAMFPTALIAFDYEVHISAWSKGKLIHRQQLFCQAQAICEMIQCTVCWESIYNLHCWTKIQLVIAGLITIIAFIGLTLLSPLLHLFALLVDIMFRMCRFAVRRLRPCPTRQKRPSGFRQYTGYRRKLLIAIIIFGLQSSTPCSDFISFTASEEMCVSSETNQTCTYNQATIMTLQPLDQETCLILKDNERQISWPPYHQDQGHLLHMSKKNRVLHA